MNNKYLLTFAVLMGLILLAIVLDPNFTGFAIFDNTIKHGQAIKVEGAIFKVEFGENKIRLASDQGEVIFQGTDKEVLQDKIFLLSDINHEQKTAKLTIQQYDLAIDIKRAVDIEELVVGDEVTVRTTITNNELQPLSLEYHQYISPGYQIQPAIKVNNNPGKFQAGKETYKYLVALQPNEQVILEYTLKLINPDVKNTAVPKATLLQDVGENAFEIQAKEIAIKVTPMLSFDLAPTENLAISKQHPLTLTLKNNFPQKPITIKELKISFPNNVEVQSSELIKKGVDLVWQGTLSQSKIMPFTISSDTIDNYDLFMVISYEVNGLQLTTKHQQKLSFEVIPLVPSMALNKESFNAGENIEITPSFENEAGTSFKELDAKLTLLTENRTIEAPELEGKEKLVFDQISIIAPHTDTDLQIPVLFTGTYKTMHDKIITFSTEKVIILKKTSFDSDMSFSLLPIGYKKGTLQLLALAEKKSDAPISVMKIIHDTTKPELVTEFSEISPKSGVVFEVPTTSADDIKKEQINQKSMLIYTKDNAHYVLSTVFSEEVKKVVKQIKLSKDKYKLSDIKLIDFSSGTAPVLLNSEKQLMIYETPTVSFSLVYIILITIVVALVIIGIVWYQKREEAKHKIAVDTSFVPRKDALGVFDAPTPDKGLVEGQKFVQYCRSAHMPDEKIKIKLREKGWLEDFITELCK
ncbi:hypothetical protein HYY69_00235 [Candidatus Woesearchaeota archaeon]|nr:hypothetical protein [Candidatus Woesearchaeota archaeon]